MDHNFYSSRKERLQHASNATKQAYVKRNSDNFFKRNPHLRILVIDLFIVLLFAVIIIPFFVRLTRDVRVDDYKITPKAIFFENDILVTIKIEKLFKKIIKRITNSEILIEVLYNDKLVGSEIASLPLEIQEYKYISFKLANGDEVETINIRLSSAAYSKQIVIPINQ